MPKYFHSNTSSMKEQLKWPQQLRAIFSNEELQAQKLSRHRLHSYVSWSAVSRRNGENRV